MTWEYVPGILVMVLVYARLAWMVAHPPHGRAVDPLVR